MLHLALCRHGADLNMIKTNSAPKFTKLLRIHILLYTYINAGSRGGCCREELWTSQEGHNCTVSQHQHADVYYS